MKISDWIKNPPRLTEAEKIKKTLATVTKICYKCNSTYPKNYHHCTRCNNEKLQIIDNSYLKERLKEIEKESKTVQDEHT